MNRLRPIFLAGLVLLLALLVRWYFASPMDTARQDPPTTDDRKTSEAAALAPVAVAASDNDILTVAQDAPSGCLSPAQLETHPMFDAEIMRLDKIAANGSAVLAYRGVTASNLRAFAAQGDDAAMLVLGAVHRMRALGYADDLAVPALNMENWYVYQDPQKSDFDQAQRADLEMAQAWFYKAALHGRLMALPLVGSIAGLLQGNAAGLGWVGDDAFATLKRRERNSLIPVNVYNRLLIEIAPHLAEGPLGEFLALGPRSDRQSQVVSQLAVQFERDRVAAGLPPVDVPPTTVPELDEIRLLLCESYLDRSGDD